MFGLAERMLLQDGYMVEITDSVDSICEGCNLENEMCEREHVQDYDAIYVEHYGLSIGRIYTSEEFRKILLAHR
jgi:hypothetical protein